jgi:SAM-dependent methyltransferase
MVSGTIDNLRRSAFVPTPTARARETVLNLLAFPRDGIVAVYDPTCGEGDLLLPCLEVPGLARSRLRLYGVEISGDRAARARSRLPGASIVECDFKVAHITRRSVGLVLANPPYFFDDGARAEYRVIADAGESLVPGGIMVAIIPARSAWRKGPMINHWAKYYEHIQCFKFPGPDSPPPDAVEGEGEDGGLSFDTYTQIVVIGVRRATPLDAPSPAEQRRLQGWMWTRPKFRDVSPWAQGSPPPDLPASPLATPYLVPASAAEPKLVAKKADEAVLLRALVEGGAHLLPAWQEATTWREEAFAGQSVLPPSGPAHVASYILTGVLDRQVIPGPDARRYVFASFVTQNWVEVEVDPDEAEEQRKRGVVSMKVRQQQDEGVLGVLCLESGELAYYQGEAVFTYLSPWLPLLTSLVLARQRPIYNLDPTEQEARLALSIGWDRQLPGAPYPGLADEQVHMVVGMKRALEQSGRIALHGEPGTGKTRQLIALMYSFAVAWKQRRESAAALRKQPVWMKQLRRAWLANPRARAMLGVTPEASAETGQVIAYRHAKSGKALAPQDVGPSAPGFLVATPRKVLVTWQEEIRGAWPQAEVILIEDQHDITRWMERCAVSRAPAVIGVVPLSLTRAFEIEWLPAVREALETVTVPDLDPPAELRSSLKEMRNAQGELTGYLSVSTGELLTKTEIVTHFFCPDCGGRIDAVPRAGGRAGSHAGEAVGDEEEEEGAKPLLEDDKEIPVTSLTWFKSKPRTCTCLRHKPRPAPSDAGGAKAPPPHCAGPLWTQSRWAPTRRKYPGLSYAEWAGALEVWRAQVVECEGLAGEAHARQPFTPGRPLGKGKKPMLQALREANPGVAALRLEKLPPDVLAQLREELTYEEREALAAAEQAARSVVVERATLDDAGLADLRARLVAGASRVLLCEEKSYRGDVLESFHLITLVEPECVLDPALSGDYEQVLHRQARAGEGGEVTDARLVPVGYRHRETHALLTRTRVFLAVPPPSDSFSPYDYLYRQFRGCVALSIIDESHNARGRSTDIAQSVHYAQLSAQGYVYASGTHYGGALDDFFYYWFRFHPQFWLRLGLSWKDVEKAIRLYGVIQEVTKERESDARRGTGTTDISVSTRPAPGISARLLPHLLACMVYIAILDVGTYMPDRIEIPELIPMTDDALREPLREASAAIALAKERLTLAQEWQDALLHPAAPAAAEVDTEEISRQLTAAAQAVSEAQEAFQNALAADAAAQAWADERDLDQHYRDLVKALEDQAKERNSAAQIALGTVPRWYAALPTEAPYEVSSSVKDDWGNVTDTRIIARSRSLTPDYHYPLELRLVEIVKQELAQGRRIMVYVEQTELRSMPRRLQRVLEEWGLQAWSLPASVKPENREGEIRRAVNRGNQVVIVPARKVNEGINLQDCLDVIVWYEMPMNLFLLDQASRRLWRLNRPRTRPGAKGSDEGERGNPVLVYYLAYAGTAAHRKMRALALRSGAASAFAGEPPKGALVESVGANRTMLARLSHSLTAIEGGVAELDPSLVADEAALLREAFFERAKELRRTLDAGRQWIGVTAEARHPQLFVDIRELLKEEHARAEAERAAREEAARAAMLRPQDLVGLTAHSLFEVATDEELAAPAPQQANGHAPAVPPPAQETAAAAPSPATQGSGQVGVAPIGSAAPLSLFAEEGRPAAPQGNGPAASSSAHTTAQPGAGSREPAGDGGAKPPRTWDELQEELRRLRANKGKLRRQLPGRQAPGQASLLSAHPVGEKPPASNGNGTLEHASPEPLPTNVRATSLWSAPATPPAPEPAQRGPGEDRAVAQTVGTETSGAE